MGKSRSLISFVNLDALRTAGCGNAAAAQIEINLWQMVVVSGGVGAARSDVDPDAVEPARLPELVHGRAERVGVVGVAPRGRRVQQPQLAHAQAALGGERARQGAVAVGVGQLARAQRHRPAEYTTCITIASKA